MHPPEPPEPAPRKRSSTPRTDRFEATLLVGDCPRCAYAWSLPTADARAPNRCPECGLTQAARHRFILAYRTNAKLQRRHRRALSVIASLLYAVSIVTLVPPLFIMMVSMVISLFGAALILLWVPVVLGTWLIAPPLALCFCLSLLKHDRADRVLFGRELTFARWCTYAAIPFFPAMFAALIYDFSLSALIANPPVLVLVLIGAPALLTIPFFMARRLTVLAARAGAFRIARSAERLTPMLIVVYALVAVPFVVQGAAIAFPNAPGAPWVASFGGTLLSLAALLAVIVLIIRTVGSMKKLRDAINA